MVSRGQVPDGRMIPKECSRLLEGTRVLLSSLLQAPRGECQPTAGEPGDNVGELGLPMNELIKQENSDWGIVELGLDLSL